LYFLQDETAKWAVRPLPDFEIEVAVQNVAFLTDLYSQMKKSYFEPVKLGSEFYLNHLASMNDDDAQKYNVCQRIYYHVKSFTKQYFIYRQ
jgi:hypothetical protein